MVVDAHDEGGRDRVLGRGGKDDLLRPVLEMDGRLFLGKVRAGGFDDVLGVAVVPRNFRCVGIAVDADLLSVDDQVLPVVLHGAVKRAEHRVVLDLIDHEVQIGVAEVDAADVIAVAAALDHAAQRDAADASKTVDAYLNCHFSLPLLLLLL